MRASQSELVLKLGEMSLVVKQGKLTDKEGGEEISSIVWDCGLLMVDCLVHLYTKYQPKLQPQHQHQQGCRQRYKHILDLGCGTGVCGLAAACLKEGEREGGGEGEGDSRNRVLFSDALITPALEANINLTIDQYQSRDQAQNQTQTQASGCTGADASASASASVGPILEIEQFDWLAGEPPASLVSPLPPPPTAIDTGDISSNSWDLVLCSDVLYEPKAHPALMQLLQTIHFKALLLTYKRRNDEPEKAFLQELEKCFSVTLLFPAPDRSGRESGGDGRDGDISTSLPLSLPLLQFLPVGLAPDLYAFHVTHLPLPPSAQP